MSVSLFKVITSACMFFYKPKVENQAFAHRSHLENHEKEDMMALTYASYAKRWLQTNSDAAND